ncbi:hypothetical protein C2G38_2230931 [Gigaspora rosea]|uniref:CCHC-type domain-containing protein n=1 Tax=Gigaspora rosea TaxID=44941 RepID=A0A397U1Y3_9GLOM|nr:hypothetical protein C2G38_2230931 [Gigaspora rosea]
MDQPDLADLLYLTAITKPEMLSSSCIVITLEFISLTWTPKRPFRFNSYGPSFKSKTPTFLTHANPDQYYYNIVNGKTHRKAYPPPPTNKTRKPNQFLCYNCRQYGHYAAECTFAYVLKIDQNSDPISTESYDISSEEQDLYSGESYYEYDSDDEESEETEEETDSKFYGQEAFYQRSFGGTQIRNYRWRTNEASPTVKLILLRNGRLRGRSHSSRRPTNSYRPRHLDKNSTRYGYSFGTHDLC